MRRIFRIVIDALLRHCGSRFPSQGSARIGVDIEAGEVAAGDVQSDPMASLEEVAGRIEREAKLIDLAWLHQLWSVSLIFSL